MKKYALIIAAAAAIATACSKENKAPEADFVDAVFSFKGLPMPSKAFSDGKSAKELVVGVYNVADGAYADASAYKFLGDVSVPAGTTGDKAIVFNEQLKAQFKTKLVKGQYYKLVFWAQVPGNTHYAVDLDTHKVTVTYGTAANDETRDAFYAAYETGKVSAAIDADIELHRPFAQINVLSTNEDIAAAQAVGVRFTKSAMHIENAHNSLDLLTGAASGDVTANFLVAPVADYDTPFGSYATTHKYIAMNYVLAGERANHTVVFDVYREGSDAILNTISVSNVPFERNYRTNLIGNIFTVDAEFNLEIVPDYKTPDHNVGL